MLSSFLFSILALSTFVNALPLNAREVVDPPITVPNAQTVWVVGTQQTVTWDTSNIPPDSQLTNPNGMILLGWLTDDSENLQIDTPLAQGFPLRAGSAQITVPDVPPRTDYIVVLFGDSGNASPTFTIVAAGTAPSSSSSPPLVTDPPTVPQTPPSSAGPQSSASADDSAHIPAQNAAASSIPVSVSSASSSAPSSPATAAADTTASNAAFSQKHLGSSTIFIATIMSLALVLNV